MAHSWEFEEAIERFRVIDTSLKCIYAGQHHMYRVIAAQLRILLCDSPKPLLERLFSDLQLQRLAPVQSFAPGTFPDELAHLNALAVLGSQPVLVSCMPFEATLFFNGVEDCRPLLSADLTLLALPQWIEQLVSLHPVPVSIRQVIRTVADRGGGAHVHKHGDSLLTGLKGLSPAKLHLAALVVIAIANVMQHVGQSVVQFYERNGTKGSLSALEFDVTHPSVVNAARVPDECFRNDREVFNLLSVGPA